MRAKGVGVVCFAVCVLAAGLAPAADRDLRLIEASKRGDALAAKAFVSAGADVNATAADGATALHGAASQGDVALAAVLIGKGANVNAVTDLGITPLWIAARNANSAMAARLLDAGADPNIAPPTGQTPLMIAAGQGDAVRDVQLILNEKGFDAGRPDGVMGARTRTAIARFQADNGMEPTGEVDDTLVGVLLSSQ